MNGQFDLGAITPSRYFYSIAVLLGLLFALISGTDEEGGLLKNLLRWQFQTVGPMTALILCHSWLNRFKRNRLMNPWLKLILSGLMGVLLFSPFNLLIDIFIDAEYPLETTWPAAWLEELGYFLPPALISWLAINAPWVLGFRLQTSSAAASIEKNCETENSLASSGTFLELLAKQLPGELIYLKAELHYMQAVTREGKTLLLYNLKDAIAELEKCQGYDGFHAHRSYWVASAFVKKLKRMGRQGALILEDGTEIPVSRNKLREAQTRFPNN